VSRASGGSTPSRVDDPDRARGVDFSVGPLIFPAGSRCGAAWSL
jgi:hypothetical protein